MAPGVVSPSINSEQVVYVHESCAWPLVREQGSLGWGSGLQRQLHDLDVCWFRPRGYCFSKACLKFLLKQVVLSFNNPLCSLSSVFFLVYSAHNSDEVTSSNIDRFACLSFWGFGVFFFCNSLCLKYLSQSL